MTRCSWADPQRLAGLLWGELIPCASFAVTCKTGLHFDVPELAIRALSPEDTSLVGVGGKSGEVPWKVTQQCQQARRGYTLSYSYGWEVGKREKAALCLVPDGA